MNREELTGLLSDVQQGRISLEQAVERFVHYPTRELNSARLDLHREMRSGFAEVVYAEGKTPAQLLDIVSALLGVPGRVLITRLKKDHILPLRESFPSLIIHEDCGVAHSSEGSGAAIEGCLAVVTAGTSDKAVAQEAAVCARYFGLETTLINDVGIAGLHRLLDVLPILSKQDMLIVVAGMEGALPGVIGGMCPVPVIAVPTSVGYGASFGGITAFLSMLVSCSPGHTVVNIDNGFGAALAAARIIRHLKRKGETR